MALKDGIEGGIGTLVALFGGWLGLRTYRYTETRDKTVDTNAEIADAVAEENRIATLEAVTKANSQKLDFIVDQLGKNPNGGNAMQQLLEGQRRNETKIDALANDTGSKLLDLSKHILEIGANLTSHVINHKEQ